MSKKFRHDWRDLFIELGFKLNEGEVLEDIGSYEDRVLKRQTWEAEQERKRIEYEELRIKTRKEAEDKQRVKQLMEEEGMSEEDAKEQADKERQEKDAAEAGVGDEAKLKAEKEEEEKRKAEEEAQRKAEEEEA